MRFDNILAITTPSGRRIGFHSRNMQVAVLTDETWSAMQGSPTERSPEALEARAEIEEWNCEIDPAATDIDIAARVRSLMVNVAQVCNLKCTYCAAGGDGTFGQPTRHLDIETIFDQIQMFLHDTPSGEEFSLTFFGGEPLVNPDAIVQLARFARLQTAGRNIRLRFCLITNATLVTQPIAEMLAGIGCHVTVSLDGPSAINDLHRITVAGKGSTARVLRGLEHLMSIRARLGSLSVGSVFGQHHTGVLETYKYLRAFNFDTIKFDFAAAEDDGETSRRYAQELEATADFAFAQGGESELRKIGLFDTYFLALDRQMRLNNHCGAGKSMLSLDSKGRVTSCQWFVGKKAEELGQGTHLEHEKIGKFTARLNELNNCQSCWARHLCGGGCMFVNDLKTGSKHKKDAVFCERTRTTIAKAIEHYAQARYETEQGVGCEAH